MPLNVSHPSSPSRRRSFGRGSGDGYYASQGGRRESEDYYDDEDLATPTTATFALDNRARGLPILPGMAGTGLAADVFVGCDAGDILDDLVGLPVSVQAATVAVTAEAAARPTKQQRSVGKVDDDDDDDAASTCSSTTATEDCFDNGHGNYDDNSSLSSTGGHRRSLGSDTSNTSVSDDGERQATGRINGRNSRNRNRSRSSTDAYYHDDASASGNSSVAATIDDVVNNNDGDQDHDSGRRRRQRRSRWRACGNRRNNADDGKGSKGSRGNNDNNDSNKNRSNLLSTKDSMPDLELADKSRGRSRGGGGLPPAPAPVQAPQRARQPTRPTQAKQAWTQKQAAAHQTAQQPVRAHAHTREAPPQAQTIARPSSSTAGGRGPRSSRAPRLLIGLDLEAELELKSKVKGDVCLTLLLEDTKKMAPRLSPEVRRTLDGHYTVYDGDETGSDSESETDGTTDGEAVHGTPEKATATRLGQSNGAGKQMLFKRPAAAAGSTSQYTSPRAKQPSKAKPRLPFQEQLKTAIQAIDSIDDDASENSKNSRCKGGSNSKQVGRDTAAQNNSSNRREICHLRVGRFNMTRRWWLDSGHIAAVLVHVPPPVLLAIVVSLLTSCFAAGWAAGVRWATRV